MNRSPEVTPRRPGSCESWSIMRSARRPPEVMPKVRLRDLHQGRTLHRTRGRTYYSAPVGVFSDTSVHHTSAAGPNVSRHSFLLTASRSIVAPPRLPRARSQASTDGL